MWASKAPHRCASSVRSASQTWVSTAPSRWSSRSWCCGASTACTWASSTAASGPNTSAGVRVRGGIASSRARTGPGESPAPAARLAGDLPRGIRIAGQGGNEGGPESLADRVRGALRPALMLTALVLVAAHGLERLDHGEPARGALVLIAVQLVRAHPDHARVVGVAG